MSDDLCHLFRTLIVSFSINSNNALFTQKLTNQRVTQKGTFFVIPDLIT